MGSGIPCGGGFQKELRAGIGSGAFLCVQFDHFV